MPINNIYDQLRRDEDDRQNVYDDATGKPIKAGSYVEGNPTIGVGRNLVSNGLYPDERELMLHNDVERVTNQLSLSWPWMDVMDNIRHAVLVNMAFNMGVAGLSKFVKFLAAVQQGDWQTASQEMLDSAWATQVGARAQRLAVQMNSGQWQ